MSKFKKTLEKLVKALNAGNYAAAPSQLSRGAALIVEDLDTSGMGLYNQIQKDDLVKSGVSEDDFFLAEESIGRWGVGYYMRKTDEGTKRHTFYDKDLKLHKDLVKKKDE